MAEVPYLVDSNVLIRWVQPSDPGYAVADASLQYLENSDCILCFTSQNLGEFWNALTRPSSRNGYGLSPQEADHCAFAVESRLQLLPDSLAVHREWRKLLVDYQVSGVQVHDARLVASMQVYRIERILTFNTKDFQRFTGVEAVHPAQVS
jgi:predicted nucleic acid-binding protein